MSAGSHRSPAGNAYGTLDSARLTMTVSPRTSSTTTDVFSAIGVRVAGARDLVDQFLADPAAHLADPPAGIAIDDAADLTDEILGAAVGARLLAVEKAREQ